MNGAAPVDTPSTGSPLLLHVISLNEKVLLLNSQQINKVVQTYDTKMYADLVPITSDGRLRFLKECKTVAEMISPLILAQTVFLLISVIGSIIMGALR